MSFTISGSYRPGRRAFLSIAGAGVCHSFSSDISPGLKGQVGVTTGSFMRHLTFESSPRKIRMLDLPAVMRNELDMRVIDLMSRTLESFETGYLEKLRSACDSHNCIVTNLKCNQPGVDMASPDKEIRVEALRIYKQSIDAAQLLGARWIRPFAGSGKTADRNRLADSYRELIDYGANKNISIIIENVGWISKDPDVIPDIIKRVGEGLHAGPDTGNWTNDTIRYAGLAKAYPFAVTSDFKAFQFDADGTHPKYDLRKCFDTGWDAGFRGPWCIEHFHNTLPGLIKGFGKVRDYLRRWSDEKTAAE